MTKYIYKGNAYATRSEAVEAVNDWVDEHLDDIIDDEVAPIVIYGMHYNASRILSELDPIAYNCLATDIADDYCRDIEEVETEDETED